MGKAGQAAGIMSKAGPGAGGAGRRAKASGGAAGSGRAGARVRHGSSPVT